jgi:hypothetical protein
MIALTFIPKPFALSLSKGCPFSFATAGEGEGQGFDELSPNGLGNALAPSIS